MQPAGPNELGYANTALVTALFDLLANKGLLTTTDLETIVTNAIQGLEPDQNISSVNGAITFIKAAVLPQIGKNGAA